MKILLAKSAGFCMGVKRAMNLALETSKVKQNVYTCGPLIHNPQAVEYLQQHQVSSVNNISELTNGTLIIRAHGMPKTLIEKVLDKNIEIVDATCPHVLTSQNSITNNHKLGYFIAIVGDKNHPEILSLQSFAPDNHKVISTMKEAKSFNWPNRLMVIAQTTFSVTEYQNIATYIKSQVSDIKIANSICRATYDRQNEIIQLAKIADAVIVIGGKASANTKRLAQIAKESCKHSFHIETADEIDINHLKSFETIAVTAGASTPDFIINNLIDTLKKI